MGDRIQLQQLILNLILNGFEAMINADKRALHIRTARGESNTVMVCVNDSGSGIDEEIMGRVFEPFFTTKKEGMGMGLAINKAIVEAHGGRLWAENNPDQGVTFYVTLPIAGRRSK